MSFCTQQVLTLASGLYADLNSPSNISVAFISGVLTSSGQLGAINNRLNGSFHLSGDAPCIVGFGAEEAAIYSLMYESEYYRREGLRALQGGGTVAFTTNIRDGDSSWTREAPSKVAAEWRALHKETEEELHVAVANYLKGKSLTVSVDAAALASWPSP